MRFEARHGSISLPTGSLGGATQEPEQIRTGRGEFCKNMIIDYYAYRIIFLRIYVK